MRLLSLALLCLACSPDRTPTWATDTLEVVEGPTSPVAFQTWTLYGPDFADNPRERTFACAVVVTHSLVPCEGACVPCDGCETAWEASETSTDSDCETLPTLPTLTALAVGPLPDELANDPRWPDAEHGSWARYGEDDWVSHGWALATGEQDDSGTLDVPWIARPAYAWPLEE